MKGFVWVLALLIIAAGLWHDLTNGSLPHAAGNEGTKIENESPPVHSLPYKKVKVGKGDTVLSILTTLHDGKLPADIETAIADFQELNDGMAPDSIQVGTTYLFPLYP
ncbi:hypothetical protein [Bacillus thermotolerans]|uniref:hypothetical protein n=1 Tax=Bacillus thermotolerans TaxID=1221996 RepID=UPI00057EE2B0|nr:hypothetical protein [Bacillus thermotolerans]KKB33237.1 hypothetical protein QY97_03606 [Bacillus thermotolerans]